MGRKKRQSETTAETVMKKSTQNVNVMPLKEATDKVVDLQDVNSNETVEVSHTIKPLLKCDECEFTTENVGDLRTHIYRMHTILQCTMKNLLKAKSVQLLKVFI